MAAKKVFAIGAHPDDIEFGMAGTMLRLAQAGCELHYMTFCNGSCGSNVMDQAETVSIWHPGHHDNPFGMRLSALMISKKIPDAAVPMSFLADHPDVRFNFYRPGIGTCEVEMH